MGKIPAFATLAAAAALLLPSAQAGTVSSRTTYRIIPLSSSVGNADINAKGQVAFTEGRFDDARAKFYDGRKVEDIGTLGGRTATVVAINDAGQIAGTSVTGTDGLFHAFRWSRSEGMRDLAAPFTGNSYANDINAKGWVTGTAEFLTGSQNAFRWTPATGMLDLNSLSRHSDGYAINDAGTVAGASNTVEGGQVAVRWEGMRLLPLAPFSPGPFSTAWDINNAGQVVGTFDDRAFMWSGPTGLVDLGVRALSKASADRINDKGVVIGNLYNLSRRGFVWSREHGPLVFSGNGIDSSSAVDLNNHGQVVGGVNGRAFIWTRGEGIVDLNTRIPGAPPDLVLHLGVAISDNGSIVAATNTGGLVLLVPRSSGRDEAPVAGIIRMTGTPRPQALLSFHAAFRDADPHDTHRATWDWGDGTTTTGTVSEKNGSGNVSAQHAWRQPGTYTVKLTIVDSSGKRSTVQRTVAVCASGAGIAGTGAFLSPAGALRNSAASASLATFAFTSENGAGQAQVRFQIGNLGFSSSRVESVRREGGRIELRGSGTVNGRGNYRFLLNAGEQPGERIRVRISRGAPQAEVVEYDNALPGTGNAGSAIVGQPE